MSKGEPSSYHESLDVQRWKADIARLRAEGSEHSLFWAEHYEVNLIRALMEREAAKPGIYDQERQRKLVEREVKEKRLRLIK